jgi:hypothetical protein
MIAASTENKNSNRSSTLVNKGRTWKAQTPSEIESYKRCRRGTRDVEEGERGGGGDERRRMGKRGGGWGREEEDRCEGSVRQREKKARENHRTIYFPSALATAFIQTESLEITCSQRDLNHACERTPPTLPLKVKTLKGYLAKKLSKRPQDHLGATCST